MRLKIKEIKDNPESFLQTTQTLKGWIRTARKQKTFTFIELNDGSCLSNFQVIIDQEYEGYESLVLQCTTGAAVSVEGEIVESPAKGQAVEMKAINIDVIGSCPEDYPLQKKRHTFEFLRQIAHLRPRTNTIGAMSRVRNTLAFATHKFFQDKGFIHLHSPIITASDCEGAGEMFRVTTLEKDLNQEDKDFFGKKAHLTVSGQLNGEIFASALSDIYTFGPTFRAENSNTARHLAEFWMIEPECAFIDFEGLQDLSEEFLKYTFKTVLEKCPEDMEFFNRFISKGVLERLQEVVEKPFERASYTYAIRVLERSNKSFENPVEWGKDLQTEHERYLSEEYFGKPVIITDYPKEIKAFYMRLNEDQKTVSAMDVLVPKIGEIIGGSQREERLDVLQTRMKHSGLTEEDYWWYLDLRRFGSVPHGGFGAGFERMVQFATGLENIRDTIPFPRYPGHADF